MIHIYLEWASTLHFRGTRTAPAGVAHNPMHSEGMRHIWWPFPTMFFKEGYSWDRQLGMLACGAAP